MFVIRGPKNSIFMLGGKYTPNEHALPELKTLENGMPMQYAITNNLHW